MKHTLARVIGRGKLKTGLNSLKDFKYFFCKSAILKFYFYYKPAFNFFLKKNIIV